MIFGSKYALGVLRDEADGNADGGGDDKPITAADLAKILADHTAKLTADFEKKQTDAQKKADAASKAAEAKRLADEDARKKAEETERLRKEEEARAAGGGNDQKLTYELNKLKEKLADSDQKREAAEKRSADKEAQMVEKDRIASIKAALGTFELKGNNQNIAYRTVKDDITIDDDGKLVGPGAVPLEDYLANLFKAGGDLEGLLPVRQSGGSGATSSRGVNSGAVDIDSIKPGADNSAARRAIAELVAQQARR